MKTHLLALALAVSVAGCASLLDPHAAQNKANAITTVDHLLQSGQITPEQRDEIKTALTGGEIPDWVSQVLSVLAGVGLTMLGIRVRPTTLVSPKPQA